MLWWSFLVEIAAVCLPVGKPHAGDWTTCGVRFNLRHKIVCVFGCCKPIFCDRDHGSVPPAWPETSNNGQLQRAKAKKRPMKKIIKTLHVVFCSCVCIHDFTLGRPLAREWYNRCFPG
jgi:hypothetical protein